MKSEEVELIVGQTTAIKNQTDLNLENIFWDD